MRSYRISAPRYAHSTLRSVETCSAILECTNVHALAHTVASFVRGTRSSSGGCSLRPSMAIDEAFAKCRHAWSEPKLTLHGVTEGEGCLLEDRKESRPDDVNMGRADAWRETSSIRTPLNVAC